MQVPKRLINFQCQGILNILAIYALALNFRLTRKYVECESYLQSIFFYF